MSVDIALIEPALAHFGIFPEIPPAAAVVLPLLNDLSTTPEELERALELEPTLAATILRTVNSAQFGLHEEVRSLTSAIQLMGFLHLRSLTMAAVAAGLRHTVATGYSAESERLWLHAMNVGIGARRLGERAGLPWSEEAFVAGLLHDCGRTVMLAQSPAEYGSIMRARRRFPDCTVEQSSFGVDHATVGAALMHRWAMPEQLFVVCAQHHRPIDPQHPHAALLTLVALADRFDAEMPVEDLKKNADAIGLRGLDLDAVGDEVRHEVVVERESLAVL